MIKYVLSHYKFKSYGEIKMDALLSIIIPMYGVEAFIEKCLDSITTQTYRNLEIICVNDGTKDRSAEIAEEFAKRDPRIRVVHNEQNLGLFRARVEGLKVANGDYYAFVDADDYVTPDWFRLLLRKAIAEDADIVIGNDVSVDENGNAYYHNNYKSMTKSHKPITGEDVLDAFYAQGGGCYAWHVVWNKVYSAKLIQAAMPYISKIDFHLIMCEDIAFSSVFYTHASKVCFTDADCYFYYRHSGASTSTTISKERLIKNIIDVGKVFDFVESSLSDYNREKYEKYKSDIAQLRARYQRIWFNAAQSAGYESNAEVKAVAKQAFGNDFTEPSRPFDFYFYDLTTGKSMNYEKIKAAICDESVSIVSFDIFDTLIKRPFYNPSDIFRIVGRQIAEKYGFINEDTFPKLRLDAEKNARGASKLEDITITEIYEELARMLSLSQEQAEEILALELEAEKKYCTARNSGKELFELVQDIGKPIIMISDMYLERSTIEAILEKNGYTGYYGLFLSSEIGALKATGRLFRHAIEAIDIKANNILHIGDTWGTDVEKAKACGMQAAFLPKATDTFENIFGDIYTGSGAMPFKMRSFSLSDSTSFMDQLPARCALGVMVNNAFDNPFTSFQQSSNFNGDSYYMGYYGLGMHVLGLAEWIYKSALENGYKKIVFLARDGKLLKDAFDYLCKARGSDIKTEYFYATRKSLMPYSIQAPEDFYNIDNFVGVYYITPERIIEMFGDILLPLDKDARRRYEQRGIRLDEKLKNANEFRAFISALIEISYSEEKRLAQWEIAQDAFGNIFDENTATFDLGYSGRLQSIICNLARCSVDTFFVFTNGYNTATTAAKKFKVHSYYDYTPSIGSITREFFMSDPSPSCHGYEFKDGKVIPLLDEPTASHSNDCVYAINEMQKAALDYCKAYWDIFGELGEDFVARRSDYAIAFDYLLMNASEFDRYAFRSALVDDEVFSGYDARSLHEFWAYHLSRISYSSQATGMHPASVEYFLESMRASKVKKAITYFLFDRYTFKQKFKEKFKKHKIFLGICKFFYSIPRAVYRLFKRKK